MPSVPKPDLSLAVASASKKIRSMKEMWAVSPDLHGYALTIIDIDDASHMASTQQPCMPR
jgi:hypothetical protein